MPVLSDRTVPALIQHSVILDAPVPLVVPLPGHFVHVPLGVVPSEPG